MLKILVVDDSETVRLKIIHIIKEMGHAVLEAGNGLEGLEVLTKNPGINLCICDINMPEMDGLTMVAEVRKMENSLKDLIIFMCTTEASKSYKEKAKSLGVRGWLQKPFKTSQITHLIKFIDNEVGG
jgi:two-component system chemotaxis response regulator CheY